MTSSKQLLADIEQFLRLHGMPPTKFGRLACRDPHVVSWLRDGNGVTARRLDQVRAFMAAYRPEAGRRSKRPEAAA